MDGTEIVRTALGFVIEEDEKGFYEYMKTLSEEELKSYRDTLDGIRETMEKYKS